jgi:hypothetical protein
MKLKKILIGKAIQCDGSWYSENQHLNYQGVCYETLH